MILFAATSLWKVGKGKAGSGGEKRKSGSLSLPLIHSDCEARAPKAGGGLVFFGFLFYFYFFGHSSLAFLIFFLTFFFLFLSFLS